MKSPNYSYVAYIDEAGDPGLKKVKPRSPDGASEWFIVSGALIPAEKELEAESWIAEMMDAMNSPQMQEIHFAKMTDNRKTISCNALSKKKVRLFCIISNKQNMEGYKNPFAAKMTELLPSDNWFYCWMTRILLERISDFVVRHSLEKFNEVRKVKLVFSKRGGLRYSQMNAYYQWINMKSSGGAIPLHIPWGFVDFRCLDPDLLHVQKNKEVPALQMADIAASAFFRAVDVHDVPRRDASFAKLLKPRMAADKESGLVSGYGVKLLPNWGKLNDFKVPSAQREILRYYGYPKQWWQVEEPEP